jgi:hypothetical protein
LARALLWIESMELNPKAAAFYPDIAKALVARYGFLKYPQRLEDFDESKGVTFGSGRIGKEVIEQVQVYTYGVVLDTRISTDVSQRLLEEALKWAVSELGLVFDSTKKHRWQYVSSVVFTSTVLSKAMPRPISDLAARVSAAVQVSTGESRLYEVTNLSIDFDLLTRKHPLGTFTIQRRENTPFSENKFFSSAPLPTDVHIKLLEQFESELAAGNGMPATGIDIKQTN